MTKHKMDPRFVSSQRWEINYVAKKFGISPEKVRVLKSKTGKSRLRLYNEIRKFLVGRVPGEAAV